MIAEAIIASIVHSVQEAAENCVRDGVALTENQKTLRIIQHPRVTGLLLALSDKTEDVTLTGDKRF